MASQSSETSAIKSVIRTFFDNINASDTKSLQSQFHPSANLTILRQTSVGSPDPPAISVVFRSNIETFVKMIDEGQKNRKPGEGPELFEKADLEKTDVRFDGDCFASAWAPFEVTFDGKLHHFGMMVYTFGKGESGWKIDGVVQSYRRAEGWDNSEAKL